MATMQIITMIDEGRSAVACDGAATANPPTSVQHRNPLSDAVSPSSTLPLLIWLSPVFPIGSFAYSHALEWAVHKEQIHNLHSAKNWVEDLLTHGGLRNDCVLLAAAWTAASSGDFSALAEINELALALAGSRERYLETSAQGNAFRLAITTAWTNGRVDSLPTVPGDVAYPIAVGAVSAADRIALLSVLEAFATAAVSNLMSALVRLSAIGQSDGQRLIASLLPQAVRLATFAATSTLDDLGGCAFQSDIASLRHETQYTRLFRT